MDREDVINEENDGRLVYTIADVENLIAIAVAAEREACADICEAYYDTLHAPWPPAHEEPTHEPPRLDEHTHRHGGE